MDATQVHPDASLSGLLAGKVAIITGASRGIGMASARAFAEAGATVVLAARDQEALAAVAHEILDGGGEALAVPADVGDARSVETLVERTIATFGRLDIAFNNAGEGHMPTPLADIAVEDFERCVRVNLTGVFLSMKYELAAMLGGGGGAIVNMSSTAGLNGAPGMGAYAASKHGVIGLTRTAALDYATRGIRVNAIAPGPVENDRIALLPAAAREQISGAVPIGRIGDPREIAATAAWMCSDHASFITGVTLPIDGGRTSRNA